ncbi:hypothetical protein CEXT_507491 [Caerostris extrusa]|uniref:Uncharacterized protein n=1 Tax=Caerostris extrusa TaxID=172846 RepID=A0AAV4N952_CAEEX|nr:hypothetical protein CEXT_507491 [Caerostris extrusa]
MSLVKATFVKWNTQREQERLSSSNCCNKSPSAAIFIWDVKCRVTGNAIKSIRKNYLFLTDKRFYRNVSGQGDVRQTERRESKNDFHRSNCRNKSPSAAIFIWDVKCRVTGNGTE